MPPSLHRVDAAVARWLRLPVWLRAVPPCAIMVALWWSSSRELTGREPSVVRALLHNSMHVVAYGLLAGSCLAALARQGDDVSRRQVATWIGFGVALAYGVVDELHQSFVPTRSCSVADLMSDAAGAWLALLLLRRFLEPAPAPLLPLLAAVASSIGCVAFATWGPW